MKFPRLVIAGTHSNVGKTTITLGLLAALSARMKVQAFKVGPDYIDSAFHTFVTGRNSRNLDGWLIEPDILLYLFNKNVRGADIALVEGVMGLFDGAGAHGDEGSTAQIAKILKAPVLLVVDGSGMARSAAALVQGYRDFDPDLDIVGIILNRVSGEGHFKLLKEAVEGSTGIPVLGYMPKNHGIELPSRHLGLVPEGELKGLREKVERLGKAVEQNIDIDALIRIAFQWEKDVPPSTFSINRFNGKIKVPIGIAKDKAFNFYYQDNLDLLEEMGAELHYFSPLNDSSLPSDIGGIIIGGGFPEIFAAQLEENYTMRKAIKQALERGMPYIAECGGMMYLGQTLENLDGKAFEMVGWLSGKSRMTSRLQRFGYAHLKLKGSCPLGKEGSEIRVHEFHYSVVEGASEEKVYHLVKLRKGKIFREWECGYYKGNGVAGYPHLHFYSNMDFAWSFINTVRKYLIDLKSNGYGKEGENE